MTFLSPVSTRFFHLFTFRFPRRYHWLFLVFLGQTTLLPTPAGAEDLFVYQDLNSGIYSNTDNFVSYGYMRHLWTTDDGVMTTAVQKGGYQGQGLMLYRTVDDGLTWLPDLKITANRNFVSDGVMDSKNDILLVTSLLTSDGAAAVNFVRLQYHPRHQRWSLDPQTPTQVFASTSTLKATRASIARDSKGILWCAFRLEHVHSRTFEIRVFYSADGGATWEDSGNSFGTRNGYAEKCAKVIAVGQRMAMIFQDVKGASSAPARIKNWAYREDYDGLQSAWTSEPIARMASREGDPYGSHWSVAADDFGNLHLSYEDNGIKYIKYDASSDSWGKPLLAFGHGNYSNISVGENSDVYVTARNKTGRKIVARRYSSANGKWTNPFALSSKEFDGLLRMNGSERFYGHLPLLYQVNDSPPFELIYVLMDDLN
jgi:hypothetical protein